MVDWSKLEKKVEADKGAIRGQYQLSEEDKENLTKLLEKHGGRIMLETPDVLEIFYIGRGNPVAQSVATALNRNFGEKGFRFATRERGQKIAIELRE